MALAHPLVQRLPLTTPLVYLLIGFALGPLGFGVMQINPIHHAKWLLHAAEISVIISLFTVGMKLRLSVLDRLLWPALCLASLSMVLTIAFVAVAAVWLLKFPVGAAILLGAVLAPTDPVLASEVQMRHPLDRDKLRLTLSVEGGLNDGTAFPFVLLGLALMATGDTTPLGWRWFWLDGVWAVIGGIGIGAAIGYGLGRFVLRKRSRTHPLPFGEYLVLGTIGVAYGLAVQARAYGFLAVFAAGVALRAAERRASRHSEVAEQAVADLADGEARPLPPVREAAPAYFAGALLATNEQLERILEVALVLIVGAMLATIPLSVSALWLAALLFFVIRPLATLPLLAVGKFTAFEFGAIAWFGIRGIGSIYYVMYAILNGLSPGLIEPFMALVLSIIALSVVAHGVSVTPLLAWRARRDDV